MGENKIKMQMVADKEARKETEEFLSHVASNLDEYDPFKLKDKINVIEDNILSEDPLLEKGASLKMIEKINKIRDDINIVIAKECDEVTEEFEEETKLAKEGRITDEDIAKEIEETGKAIESVDPKFSEDNKRRLDAVLANLKTGHIKKAEKETSKKGKNYAEEKKERLEKEAQEIGEEVTHVAPGQAGGVQITEDTFESKENADEALKKYKMGTGATDANQYQTEESPEEPGKYKINQIAFVKSGRVHKGKLVRILNKEALAGTSVIKCTTPDCYNNAEGTQCMKRMIRVSEGDCLDYEMGEKQAAKNQTLSAREESAEIEKDVPVEEVKEVSEEEAIGKMEEGKVEQKKELADVKSEVWEEAGAEAIDEYLDLDEASSSFYKKMVSKLEERLENDQLSEEEFNILLDELEELNDEDVLKEYLEQELMFESTREDVGEEKKEEEKPEEEIMGKGAPPLPTKEVEIPPIEEEGE
jgi:hypothetical protein